MTTLDLEKFNPTVAELTALKAKYQALEIQGVEDKEGYLRVDLARKELKKVRVQIEKDGKLLRSEAVAFQKKVLAKEKELIAIIEPLEQELSAKQKAIDEEKEKLKRMEVLPERQEKLKAINVEVADEFILLMDDLRFSEFYNLENSKYLEEKARKIREEQEAAAQKAKEAQEEAERKIKEQQEAIEAAKRKLEEEKLEMEREKQRQIELEAARKEAAEKARIEAEEKAKREKEEAERKLKEETERKEREEKEQIAREKAEQEKLEKQKRYQAFLAKHNYKNDGSFYIEKHSDKIVLYQRVGEFNL